MSEPAPNLPASRQEVTIDRLVSWRLRHPTAPWSQFSQLYSISPPTLRKLVNSDFFRATLADRLREERAQKDTRVRDTAEQLLTGGLSRLLERVNGDEISSADLVRATALADNIVGVSARGNAENARPFRAQPTVVINQNILHQSRERIALAREENNGLDQVPCDAADPRPLLDGHHSPAALGWDSEDPASTGGDEV